MGKFKFLTNINSRDYDKYKQAQRHTNAQLNKLAISISRKAHDSTGIELENSCSVWYDCTIEELQLFHKLTDKL